MAKENRILFVEGPDDQHTIWAICGHFKIKETFIVEVPNSKGSVNENAKAHERGGINNVLKALQANLNGSLIEHLGIVVDADDNLKLRWQSVLRILEKLGYKNLPESPDVGGTVIEQEGKPVFGVWIMPDNKIEQGFLETFLTFLVPDPENNRTWQQARKCVDQLEEKPFIKQKTDHTQKAEIHTYLAWQKEPGKSFGQAITAKYLQADNPNCEKFVEWLKRLFVD